MTYDQWLRHAIEQCTKANIDTARLDALILLEHATATPRATILAHPETVIDQSVMRQLNTYLKQRVDGMPIAYIMCKKEFFGRNFIVTPDVLIPRPESETIITTLKKYCSDELPTPIKLLDVGTGSGCLAITAKLEMPKLRVWACDISRSALSVAKHNAETQHADVTFFVSDLLVASDDKFDIIVANLPYVPTTLAVSNEVLTEPNIAVFSGSDGLDTIRRFFAQVNTNLAKGGVVLLESLVIQHSKVADIATTHGLQLKETEDLIQVFEH